MDIDMVESSRAGHSINVERPQTRPANMHDLQDRIAHPNSGG